MCRPQQMLRARARGPKGPKSSPWPKEDLSFVSARFQLRSLRNVWRKTYIRTRRELQYSWLNTVL